MDSYNPESFTIVQCLETKELFGIRSVYDSVFEHTSKEILFPCHKFDATGHMDEVPTVFKRRSSLEFKPVTKQ